MNGTERSTRPVERPAAAEDVQVTAERRHAARALLRSPLLHADGPGADDLRLVRRHRVELARMFADGLGYRLVVEPGAARLFKAGLGRDATRPLGPHDAAEARVDEVRLVVTRTPGVSTTVTGPAGRLELVDLTLTVHVEAGERRATG